MTGGPRLLSGDGSSGFPSSTLLQAEFPLELYLLIVFPSLQSCCCSLGSLMGTLPGPAGSSVIPATPLAQNHGAADIGKDLRVQPITQPCQATTKGHGDHQSRAWMGRCGSAIESGADDAVNPPDMDTVAWLCGSLQLSRNLKAISVRKGAGLWQHISTQGWGKGEHHSCYFGGHLWGSAHTADRRHWDCSCLLWISNLPLLEAPTCLLQFAAAQTGAMKQHQAAFT